MVAPSPAPSARQAGGSGYKTVDLPSKVSPKLRSGGGLDRLVTGWLWFLAAPVC